MSMLLLERDWWRVHVKRQFGALLTPLLSQEPAARLIRRTAREQWRLIALNLGSSLLVALTEGATLGMIFLAVRSLASPEQLPLNWTNAPFIGQWSWLTTWLNNLNPGVVFLTLLGLAVLLQAVQSVSIFINQLSVGYFAARCVAKVTSLIHHQILSFSFACASAYKVGDLTNHVGTGPAAVRGQIEATGGLAVGLLMIATYLAVLVRISPWLLLAGVLLGGLLSALQKLLLPRLRRESQWVMDRQVAISTRVTEDIQGLRLLHSTGELDHADRQFSMEMGELEQALRKQSLWMAVLNPVANFLPILAIALIISLSLLVFQSRSAGVLPNLVTFVLALQRLNQRLSGVANTFTTITENSSRLQRLNDILGENDKQFRRKGGRPFQRLHHSVRFEDVGLQYRPGLPAALSHLSFTLAKGQMLALVGASGAGKSSIADLLTGLYSPSTGKIWIDDTPLDQLDLNSWQQRLGVVSQDTFLFNATIAENIAFGMPGATQRQIESACQSAQAAGFIESLPQAYNTLVGERGYRLSGGQRQRLSLARAILRAPELLILDEATSALDSQSERLVQEAIERFEGNQTLLVIAHRLSTIVHSNQILVLADGRIVQCGNHDSLLAQQGLYLQLWQQQSRTQSARHGL